MLETVATSSIVEVEGRKFKVVLYPREGSMGFYILEIRESGITIKFSSGIWGQGYELPSLSRFCYQNWRKQNAINWIKNKTIEILDAADKSRQHDKCSLAKLEDGQFSEQHSSSETTVSGLSGWPEWLTFFFRCMVYCAGEVKQEWRSCGGVRNERHLEFIKTRLESCQHCIFRGCCNRPCLRPQETSQMTLRNFTAPEIDTQLWSNLLKAEPFVRPNTGENRKEGRLADADPVKIWISRRDTLINANISYRVVKSLRKEE